MHVLQNESIELFDERCAWVNEDWTRPRVGAVQGVAQPETNIAALDIHEADRSVPLMAKGARAYSLLVRISGNTLLFLGASRTFFVSRLLEYILNEAKLHNVILQFF